ncbi:hypothetical protein VNO78_18052 [Psophocarpus tetragonolobus]|uniref:Uncharacterized protein n=1 Tax=Psophocarpus tetragonolobus TaxID=3891 RepID=A0AAN9SIM6_PSOTE
MVQPILQKPLQDDWVYDFTLRCKDGTNWIVKHALFVAVNIFMVDIIERGYHDANFSMWDPIQMPNVRGDIAIGLQAFGAIDPYMVSFQFSPHQLPLYPQQPQVGNIGECTVEGEGL